MPVQKKLFAGILKNICSEKLHKIWKKTTEMESFLNKVVDLVCYLNKKGLYCSYISTIFGNFSEQIYYRKPSDNYYYT